MTLGVRLSRGISRLLIVMVALSSAMPAYSEEPAQEVVIPAENRAAVAAMLKPLRSVVKTGGKVSVGLLANMATFYMTMAGLEAWSCHRANDPVPCEAYVKRLRDPAEEIGFALFVLTSQATHKRLGQYGSLALGYLVNEVFDELWRMPEVKEYRKTSEIADPALRKKKRDELLAKIYAQTFNDPEWRKEKVPALTALVAAAAASTATTTALRVASVRLNAASERAATQGASACPNVYLAISNAIGAFVSPTEKGGVSGFLQRRGTEAAGLLVFMGYDHLIRPSIDRGWEFVTLDSDLNKTREKLKNESAISEKDIQENSKLWNRYRRKRMASVEGLLSPHLDSLSELDSAVSRPADFYNWFANGMKTDDFSWTILQEKYFSKSTKPSDIQPEIDNYLRSFFCGAAPKKAFRDSRSVSGVPIPGELSPSVTPYRVSAPENPEACAKNASSAEFARMIKANDYGMAVRTANAEVKASSAEAREGKIRLFETRVSNEIVQLLEGKASSKNDSLPDGVLPAFDRQLLELQALKEKTGPSAPSLRIDDVIAHVKESRAGAQELLNYYKTPADQRKPPEKDFFSLFKDMPEKSSEGSEKSEWKKAAEYFKGYILE